MVLFRSDKSLIRKEGKQPSKPLVLIVCEGETEKLYFRAISKELRFSTIEISVPPNKGSAPKNIVYFAKKMCKKPQEPYEYVYCVFDRDNHKTFDTARKEIEVLSTRKCNPLPLKEAISIVCFEVWILLHFTKSDAQFINSDEVIKHIKKYIPDYSKADSKLFNKIKDKLSTAIENAKWLEDCAANNDYNPYTQIHNLVLLLQKLSKV